MVLPACWTSELYSYMLEKNPSSPSCVWLMFWSSTSVYSVISMSRSSIVCVEFHYYFDVSMMPDPWCVRYLFPWLSYPSSPVGTTNLLQLLTTPDACLEMGQPYHTGVCSYNCRYYHHHHYRVHWWVPKAPPGWGATQSPLSTQNLIKLQLLQDVPHWPLHIHVPGLV